MSHFKTFECKVDNVEFVKQALNDMNLQYETNTTIVDWAKQERKVDLAVVKDGKLLPLGFVMEDKELKLYADWFMTSFSEQAFTEEVAQLHDKHKVIDICQKNNWTVNHSDIEVNSNGEIELFATQWA
jgi:hypothetical protein